MTTNSQPGLSWLHIRLREYFQNRPGPSMGRRGPTTLERHEHVKSAAPTGRRQVRYDADWPCTCRDQSGSSWQGWVTDCSVGGLGLAHCPYLEIEQVIDVQLDGIGSFRGRVTWFADDRCGIALLPATNTPSDDSIDRLAVYLSNLCSPDCV